MKEKKLKMLPLGRFDFQGMIEDGCVYVDKTELIHKMIVSGKYYFLLRPRRFGKSLLVTTLQAIFSSKKELFKGLWIYASDYDWKEHPVIKIDMSGIDYTNEIRLENGLLKHMRAVAGAYGFVLPEDLTIKEALGALIDALAQKNKVVVLIDEYDKPILEFIDDPQKAIRVREVLRQFYEVIKSKDANLRFVLLTGVSKFSKTSIFSGFNNLRDISLSAEYAELLGYTQQELVRYFSAYIKLLARSLKKSELKTTHELKRLYDGYVLAPHCEPVFNPFSIIVSLTDRSLGTYWFATGTPTFLIKLIQKNVYPLGQLYGPSMRASELDAFEPDKIKITALLYQTGYLTIKKFESDVYTLDFPNYEVADGFNMLVSTSFTGLTQTETNNYAVQISQTFFDGDMAQLQEVLQSFFDEMPHDAHIAREYDLKIIIFSVFKLIGIEVNPEVRTSVGTADIVVELPKIIYIIELKFNKTARTALQQIKDKKYYAKYVGEKKKLVLVGLNFAHKTKTISLVSHVVGAQKRRRLNS